MSFEMTPVKVIFPKLLLGKEDITLYFHARMTMEARPDYVFSHTWPDIDHEYLQEIFQKNGRRIEKIIYEVLRKGAH